MSEKNAESEEQEQQDQFEENLEDFDYNEMEELNDLGEEFSEDKAEARAKKKARKAAKRLKKEAKRLRREKRHKIKLNKKNDFEETLNEENLLNDDIDTKKRIKTSKSEEIKRHKRKKAEKKKEKHIKHKKRKRKHVTEELNEDLREEEMEEGEENERIEPKKLRSNFESEPRASHHSDHSLSPPHSPRTRSPTKSTEKNRSQSSHSRASSSSSKRSSSTHSKDTKRSYTSDSSDDEKKEKAPKLRDYGPDVSSWRMYEIEKEKAAQAASSFPLSSRGRNPNLVSTLRKPYVPGGGRKALAYFKAAARGGVVVEEPSFLGCVDEGKRGRGRGRGIMRFYGPLRPKSDYLDSSGKIDRKKLLEIATQNATKLAMEGKLPKGEELLEAIKTKSMEQLATISKQMEDEQLKVSSAPVPFVRWMSSTFALALEQQNSNSSAPLLRPKRGFLPSDNTAHLMEKVSSSEDEADKEELFQRRHESWKQRTEKRAKEREAEEAEEDSEKYIGVTKGGQPFKRSGPMLGFRDIKIKITPSQSGFSATTISSTSTLPPPPPLPSIQKLLPNITDIGSTFPSSSESYMGGFTSKSSSSIFSDTITPQRSNLHIPIQEFQQQQILQITSLFMDKPSTTSSVTSLASMLVPPPPIPPSLPPAPIPPFLLDKTKKTFEQLSSSSHSESLSDVFCTPLLPPPPAPPLLMPK
uniref:Uncharacterized protein n=1 Tax=Meloidogyne enterolobii TaxID=390850 RepID=A0A6V7UVQ4_MELEN|nr:unnamed protein product [Meloidogyne enterolobii]